MWPAQPAVCNEDSSQFLDPGEFKALVQDLQPLAPDSLDFNRAWANIFSWACVENYGNGAFKWPLKYGKLASEPLDMC